MNFFNKLNPAELERLAILGEELGEAQQIIGKILRHGYESYDPTEVVPEDRHPTQNRWLLEKECGDVLWAMSTMIAANDMDRASVDRAFSEKGPRAARYLHHQPVKHESVSCCGGVGCNSCEPQRRG